MTFAATLSLAVSHLLNLPLALWTVLTAVILTQMSVGRSLKATMDISSPPSAAPPMPARWERSFRTSSEVALLGALAIAVAPAALLAATNPRFSATPFTAVMVFLAPSSPIRVRSRPRSSASSRVAIGGFIGLAVSLLVLPARAHDLAIEGSANLLGLIRRLLPELFAGFSHGLDEQALRHMQNSIGAAFVQLDAVAAEARHERMTRLAAEPDQGPLLRTLLRLRHDLVMIGRAALEPLPEPFRTRLGPWLARIAETATISACSAAALLARRHPPPLDAVAAALDGFRRRNGGAAPRGLDANLPLECVERIFALGFALDQMHRNLNDLARCVAESAQRAHSAVPQRTVAAMSRSVKKAQAHTRIRLLTERVESARAATRRARTNRALPRAGEKPRRRCSLRAQTMQRLPLGLDRPQPEPIVCGRRLRRALVAGRRARSLY
jgi:hypothetical protein